MLAGFEQADDARGAFLFIVFVHGQHLGANAMRIEQFETVARILGRYGTNRPQHSQRTQTDVLPVTQRRGHHIQCRRGVQRVFI